MASSPSTPSPTTVPACSPPRAWRSSRTSTTRPFLPAKRSCSAGPWATSAASFWEHPIHLQCPIPMTPLPCCCPGTQWPPKGRCPVQEHKDPVPGALSEQTPGWAGPLGHWSSPFQGQSPLCSLLTDLLTLCLNISDDRELTPKVGHLWWLEKTPSRQIYK